MKKIAIFFACLLAIALCENGANVAMKAKVVNQIRDAAYNFGMNKIRNVKIENMNDGKFKLKDIKITGFEIKANEVALALQKDWIKMTMFPFAVNATMMAWNLSSNNPSWVEGKIQCSKSTVNIGIMPYFANGTATWTVHNISMSLQNIMILSDINKDQKFLAAFNGAFMKHVQAQVQATLDHISAQFPDNMNFAFRPLVFSAASVANPNISTGFVTLHLEGAVKYKGKGVSDAAAPVALPMSNDKLNKDMQLFISDYTTTTALVGMWENNYMSTEFNANTLTTDMFAKTFAGITGQYGNGKKMKFVCKSVGGNAPKIATKAGKMTGKLGGNCDVMVSQGSTFVNVMSLKGNVEFDVKVSVQQPSIVRYHFVPTKVAVTQIVKSNLKQKTTADAISTGFNAVLAKLNIFRNLDFPRIPFVILSNSEVALKDGYVSVGANTKVNNFK